MKKKTFLEELKKREQIKLSNSNILSIIYSREEKVLNFLGFLGKVIVVVLQDKSNILPIQLVELDHDTFYTYLRNFKIKPEKFLHDLDLLLLEML